MNTLFIFCGLCLVLFYLGKLLVLNAGGRQRSLQTIFAWSAAGALLLVLLRWNFGTKHPGWLERNAYVSYVMVFVQAGGNAPKFVARGKIEAKTCSENPQYFLLELKLPGGKKVQFSGDDVTWTRVGENSPVKDVSGDWWTAELTGNAMWK